MKSAQEIFDNAIFRIPDYQRGYAWEESHLDDFWQDLQNLQPNRTHYTGAITVEQATVNQYRKWTGDDWIIEGMSYKPLYVVDGQQRLTTIIILLFTIIDSLEESDQLLYQSKDQLLAKYIYKENERQQLKSYVFGYEVDNPSYEYLKTRIFRQKSPTAKSQPETVYTQNLGKAKQFFEDRIKGLSLEAKTTIFRKVTQQLKFDIKTIENDLDIFVVFETMNNRGKLLSNLEKLKNRLIYLSTLLNESDDEKDSLRRHINDVWKTVYEYLGKDKANPLDDDEFLRNHFIVFDNYGKEAEFPARNLFKEIYTVNRTTSGRLKYKHIVKYISSLQDAVEQWYIIKNPTHAMQHGKIDPEVAEWLVKINRLGFKVFAPLTLAAFLKEVSKEEKVEYLKAVESYVFLVYTVSARKSNTGNPYFLNLASKLYHEKEDWDITSVTDIINLWTYGNDEGVAGLFSIDNFKSNMKDLFVRDKTEGYYSWGGLKYVLFEYENHLRKNEPLKADWDTKNSIEHIFPQSEGVQYWKEKFRGYNKAQRKALTNSLGNLVLLSLPKNIELSNRDFDYKKKHVDPAGNPKGYFNGSHNEIEIAQEIEWTAKQILNRGLKILDFIEDRWSVALGDSKNKKTLLFGKEEV